MRRVAALLLVAGVRLAAGSEPGDRVRALQAEMQRLRGTQAQQALAKGEEALRLLNQTPDPRLEVQVRGEMARIQMRLGQLPESGSSLDRAELLAQSLGDKGALRLLGAARAGLRNLEGNHTEAVRIAQKVLQEAELAHDPGPAADALGTLGQCAGATGNFPQGIQYLHRALEYAEGMGDVGRRQGLFSVLSTFYMRTQEWDKALKANRDSYALALALDDPNRMATLSVNASYLYSRMGRPEDEYRLLMEAEAMGRKAGNRRVLMVVKVNLSDVLLKREEYRAALKEAEEARKVALQLGDRVQAAVALTNCGVALNHLGQHQAGLQTLETALKEHHAMESAGDETELLGTLSEEYAFAGEYRKALDYHRAFKEKSDKLYHDARAKTVQELEARYQSEKQERQITQLKAEGQRRRLVLGFSALGGFLALGLAAALLARYRLLRRSSSQLEALNRKLEDLSITDPLTGLRNRRYLIQHIASDTSRADRAHQAGPDFPERTGNCDLVFFLVDLDHFKHVNDTYGHHAGDQVLQQVTDRLRSATRESDDLIRWGGEEFLLVARETRREEAPVLAERLRLAVKAAPFNIGNGQVLPRTCSIGFAAYPIGPGTPGKPGWESVVDLADQALYAAKASGRDGWVGIGSAESAGLEALELVPPASLQSLVESGLCRWSCSFPDPGSLTWGTGTGR